LILALAGCIAAAVSFLVAYDLFSPAGRRTATRGVHHSQTQRLGLTVPNHTTVRPNISVSAFFTSILQVDAFGPSRFARIFSGITTCSGTSPVHSDRFESDHALRSLRDRVGSTTRPPGPFVRLPRSKRVA